MRLHGKMVPGQRYWNNALHIVGGGCVKSQTTRAESPIFSIAQGNALGKKIYRNYRPAKGNSIEPQIVALTGRIVF